MTVAGQALRLVLTVLVYFSASSPRSTPANR
jgi:hypothetical protein